MSFFKIKRKYKILLFFRGTIYLYYNIFMTYDVVVYLY